MNKYHPDITKAYQLGMRAYKTENDGLATMDRDLLALIRTSNIRGIKLIAAWRRGFFSVRGRNVR